MGGSIDEHVWRQSYKMSTSQVTFGANLIKCQLLMSTSTVILARILQSVNFSIYRYILGNTNTGVCSDIGNTNTSIHPVSYCPIWDEAVLIPDLRRRTIGRRAKPVIERSSNGRICRLWRLRQCGMRRHCRTGAAAEGARRWRRCARPRTQTS